MAISLPCFFTSFEGCTEFRVLGQRKTLNSSRDWAYLEVIQRLRIAIALERYSSITTEHGKASTRGR
jgi:hypothetical protein